MLSASPIPNTGGRDPDGPFLFPGYLISLLTLVRCITENFSVLSSILWFRRFHSLPDAICIAPESLAHGKEGRMESPKLVFQHLRGHSSNLLQDLMLRTCSDGISFVYIFSFRFLLLPIEYDSHYCHFDTKVWKVRV